jgi:hypothetical protein
MRFDTYIHDPKGNPLASFGPRVDTGEYVEEEHPDRAGFWGVYKYDAEGCAWHVGDALDHDSAAAFARNVALVAGIKALLEEPK